MKLLQVLTVITTIFLMGVFTFRAYNLIDNITNPPEVSQENTSNSSGGVRWKYGIDKCIGIECERKRIEIQEQKAKTDLIIQQALIAAS